MAQFFLIAFIYNDLNNKLDQEQRIYIRDMAIFANELNGIRIDTKENPHGRLNQFMQKAKVILKDSLSQDEMRVKLEIDTWDLGGTQFIDVYYSGEQQRREVIFRLTETQIITE